MNERGFHIGGDQREFVAVTVRRRSYPQASDYWDGNWLDSEVRIKVGGFSGGFTANFRAEEFERLLGELEALYTSLRGTAVFTTLEEQLRLELEGDGQGHIALRGQARDEAGTGHQLRFKLHLDQTMLAPVVAQLKQLVIAYPVVSRGTA